MTDTKIETSSELKDHAFEEVLGVPSGTTETTKIMVKSTTIPHEDYDDKDDEIEEDFLTIYDKSLETYETLMDAAEADETGKRARLIELANQSLNTALAAAKERRGLKQHKDVLVQKERAINKKPSAGGKSTNNIFIGSHDQLINMLAQKEDDSKILEADYNDAADELDQNNTDTE